MSASSLGAKIQKNYFKKMVISNSDVKYFHKKTVSQSCYALYSLTKAGFCLFLLYLGRRGEGEIISMTPKDKSLIFNYCLL